MKRLYLIRKSTIPKKMKSKIAFFHWLPRILCILAILFLSMFSMDAFEPGIPAGKQWLDFVIHLIPSLILLIFLVIAWKWELPGGIIFILIGVGFSPFIFLLNYHRNHSIGMSLGIIAVITVPFIIVGLLFLLSRKMKKNQPSA